MKSGKFVLTDVAASWRQRFLPRADCRELCDNRLRVFGAFRNLPL